MLRTLPRWREKYFFLFVLPMAVAIEWAFAANHDWSAYPRSEWVALVDLCLFLPLLYFFCFSREHPLKTRLLRALATAGLGLFAASYIVPDKNQFVLSDLTMLRRGLLVFIIAFEAIVFAKLIGALYRRGAGAKEIERDYAVPAWVAKLLVMEARFWKAVWNFLRRK